MNREIQTAMTAAHSADAMAAKYVRNRLDAQGTFLTCKQPAEFNGWGPDVINGISIRMFPDRESENALLTHVVNPLLQTANESGTNLLVAGQDWSTHLTIEDTRPTTVDPNERGALLHELEAIAMTIEPPTLQFDSFWAGNAFTIAALTPTSLIDTRVQIREELQQRPAELSYNGVGNAGIAHITIARFAPTDHPLPQESLRALADWSLATHRFLQEYPLTIRFESVQAQENSKFFTQHEPGLQTVSNQSHQ